MVAECAISRVSRNPAEYKPTWSQHSHIIFKMSQNVPKAHTCTKQYCHTVLDMLIKGVHCCYHTEQAKSAQKRQWDNKYAQPHLLHTSLQATQCYWRQTESPHQPHTQCWIAQPDDNWLEQQWEFSSQSSYHSRHTGYGQSLAKIAIPVQCK